MMARDEKRSGFYDWVYEGSEKYQGAAQDLEHYSSLLKALHYVRQQNPTLVVELGCGTGQWAELLGRSLPGVHYHGFDFSREAINQARARLAAYSNFIFDCVDLQRIIFQSCPLFVALEVLEHIEHDLGLLAKLPPRAPLVFSVPNFDTYGHLRHFPQWRDVMARYSKLLEIIDFSIQRFHTGNAIYTISARRCE